MPQMNFRDEFPQPNEEEVLHQISHELKGRSYESIWWETEGLRIPPYTPPYLSKPSIIERESGLQPGWILMHDLENTPEESFVDALKVLKAGTVEAIGLRSSQVMKFLSAGHSIQTLLLDAHMPDNIMQELGRKAKTFFINEDPLIPDSKKKEFTFDKKFRGIRDIEVNAAAFRDLGAQATTQVAIALSKGHEYLLGLREAGMHPSGISNSMHFSWATGLNYLPEIAALRAFRKLWHHIATAYGCKGTCFIKSRPSRFYLGNSDLHTNLLRTTTMTMSAIAGGADMIAVTPYDVSATKFNSTSARLAINIQHLLKEESYFDKVHDPAAGSYYIENLTKQIQEDVWNRFLELEDKGGFAKCFLSGEIRRITDADASDFKKGIDSGSIVMVGENKYQPTAKLSSGKSLKKELP